MTRKVALMKCKAINLGSLNRHILQKSNVSFISISFAEDWSSTLSFKRGVKEQIEISSSIIFLFRILVILFNIGCLGYPAPGSYIRPSAPGLNKSFNQLSLLLVKVQSLWFCALYFQWYTRYLNLVDLLIALLFNVHLSCFVDFILCLTDKYMFKFINKKIKMICWMCSKLKVNNSMTSFWCFYCWLGHSHHISIVLLLLTLNKYLSARCEKQVIMFWKHKKRFPEI